MNRIISFIVAVSMILFSIGPAYASNDPLYGKDNSYLIENTDSGKIFVQISDTKTSVIITDEHNKIMDVSFKYNSNPDIVYQFSSINYSPAISVHSDNTQLGYWISLLDYVEKNIDDATIVEFDEVIFDKPIDVTQSKSSAGQYFKSTLASLLGPEYYGTLKTTTPIIRYDQVFRVYESMAFYIYNTGYSTWTVTITAASLITSVLGAVVTSSLLSAICGAFGVAISVASLITPGRVNKYTCEASVYRYVTINGSSYAYNITYKMIDYKGYEDNDLNSTAPAQLDTGSQSIWYDRSQTYFNSYSLQVDDAYSMFQTIGQQP